MVEAHSSRQPPDTHLLLPLPFREVFKCGSAPSKKKGTALLGVLITLIPLIPSLVLSCTRLRLVLVSCCSKCWVRVAFIPDLGIIRTSRKTRFGISFPIPFGLRMVEAFFGLVKSNVT